MTLKINWDHKRCKHCLERMWLRGISVHEVKEALLKGKKVKQKETKLMEAFHRHYSVVYDERRAKKIRKIYPITVKLW
ncbi:MAG: hypothetical protein GXO65_06650 [Euryarchaeota archaeon]|nr:hypothetical protein [Euryarchaeota archaeon]